MEEGRLAGIVVDVDVEMIGVVRITLENLPAICVMLPFARCCCPYVPYHEGEGGILTKEKMKKEGDRLYAWWAGGTAPSSSAAHVEGGRALPFYAGKMIAFCTARFEKRSLCMSSSHRAYSMPARAQRARCLRARVHLYLFSI